jgi:hypothetical protein
MSLPVVPSSKVDNNLKDKEREADGTKRLKLDTNEYDPRYDDKYKVIRKIFMVFTKKKENV